MKLTSSRLQKSLRSRSLAATASIIGLSTALIWSPTTVAATGAEVFSSTNLPTFALARNTASSGGWWAYKFTAIQSTTVGTVDVFVQDSAGSSSFFIQIGADYNTGSVGSFAPTAAETGLTCGGQACDRLTFTGSAELTAGSDYWVWMGSSSSTSMGVDLFRGAGSTTPGLPLGYTFATGDIRTSDGGLTLNSATSGYPWIQMFAQSAQPASEASSASTPAVTLALDTDGNGSCSRRDVSSASGTWAQLPSSADCTPPAALSNATLLGWATSRNFPVAIAQRQVDNGWGAYETFNDEGQLTGVFIPAGGYTEFSNSTTLYAIWTS